MRTDSPNGRTDRANLLTACGLVAAFVAAITMVPVITDSAFAVKLESGQLPTGFDPIGAQVAMVLSVGAAVAAIVLAAAGVITKRTLFTGWVAALGALAAPYYGLAATMSVQLAFG